MSAEADVSVSKNSPHARQHALLGGMAMQGHGSRRDKREGTETIVTVTVRCDSSLSLAVRRRERLGVGGWGGTKGGAGGGGGEGRGWGAGGGGMQYSSIKKHAVKNIIKEFYLLRRQKLMIIIMRMITGCSEHLALPHGPHA